MHSFHITHTLLSGCDTSPPRSPHNTQKARAHTQQNTSHVVGYVCFFPGHTDYTQISCCVMALSCATHILISSLSLSEDWTLIVPTTWDFVCAGSCGWTIELFLICLSIKFGLFSAISKLLLLLEYEETTDDPLTSSRDFGFSSWQSWHSLGLNIFGLSFVWAMKATLFSAWYIICNVNWNFETERLWMKTFKLHLSFSLQVVPPLSIFIPGTSRSWRWPRLEVWGQFCADK